MLKLGVNVDHVATLRQARGGRDPDPVEAARVCEKAGAHSIVMHLREDRRHIQDADLFRAKRLLSVKFNLEMSIAPSIVRIAERLRPEQATLVPEKRMERTTEGGLDLFRKKPLLRRAIETLKEKNILVSLFIDPDLRQLEEAARLGADAVEFHTGDYAHQTSLQGAEKEWRRLKRAVDAAREFRIAAHAGHGLDYRNVKRVAKIKGLEELNIGYSIITRAVWVGIDRAVREMRELLR
jgi:pyridoxine 5-phosphate synthase